MCTALLGGITSAGLASNTSGDNCGKPPEDQEDCPARWDSGQVSAVCALLTGVFATAMILHAACASTPTSYQLIMHDARDGSDTLEPHEWLDIPAHAAWDSVDACTFAVWALAVSQPRCRNPHRAL